MFIDSKVCELLKQSAHNQTVHGTTSL